MQPTTDNEGLLNNFAREPKVYYAQYPTPAEQRRYIIMGVLFTLLLAGMGALIYYVS